MKKFFAAVLTLAIFALGLIFSAPAQAGDSPNIGICHNTGSGINPYTSNTVSKTAIVDGHGHGDHADDIIPSFTYSEKNDGPLLTYPGLNWDTEHQAIYTNSCVIPNKGVSPIAPMYVPATCLTPTGDLLPAVQREGVLTTHAKSLANGVWTVAYSAAEGYTFPEGISGTYTYTVTPPGPSDPNWDAEAGKCALSNTGMSGLSTSALVWGGGFIFAGMIFLGLTNFIGRRRKA